MFRSVKLKVKRKYKRGVDTILSPKFDTARNSIMLIISYGFLSNIVTYYFMGYPLSLIGVIAHGGVWYLGIRFMQIVATIRRGGGVE